jgi:4-amino-4-deoxy-L-arabinose transferase-like glycosyltransferase
MTDLYRNKRLLWALALGFVLVSLYVLGIRTLVPPDEGRYAEIAREMFASGDWITTRLNGIKYFEKPPLQAWMNALSFALFGLGEWQARLWTGLCGLLGVGLTGLAGWRVFGARVGLYGALVLGSCFYWVACSQINSLDMGLSGMMTLSLCGLLLAQHDGAAARERRNWMLACWAGMALSVLAKGLIGILLPGAVLVLYMLAARDWTIWTRLHLGKGLLLFLFIAAPWFVLVGLHNPEQPHFFFVHEHFDRFLLKEHHREAAWWVFLALLAVGSIPWLGALPQGLAAGRRRAAGVFQPRLLLLIWVVFIVAFFTESSSKLPGYILPVYPAVALLIADYLAVAPRRILALNAAMMLTLGLALLALAPFATRFAKRGSEVALYGAYQPWIYGAGLVALLGGTLALRHASRLQRDPAVLALALAGFIATRLLLAGFDPIGQTRAGANLLPSIRAELHPATRVYSVGIYEQSLTFYLRRPVILVDYRDEFDFGLQQQPYLAIPTVPAFVQQWRRDAASGVPALAIMRNDIVADLRRQGVPLRIVAGDERRTAVANH